jgi:hypothetical protein
MKQRAKVLLAEMHPKQLFSASNEWLFQFSQDLFDMGIS